MRTARHVTFLFEEDVPPIAFLAKKGAARANTPLRAPCAGPRSEIRAAAARRHADGAIRMFFFF